MARILVVHHDLTQIVLFKNVLTQQGYKAVCACDYATAVESAQRTHIQLAFFSGWLTGITCLDLAHTLRTIDPTLPLVALLSLFDLQRSRLDALNVKIMLQPLDAQKIIRAVQMHIRSDIDAPV